MPFSLLRSIVAPSTPAFIPFPLPTPVKPTNEITLKYRQRKFRPMASSCETGIRFPGRKITSLTATPSRAREKGGSQIKTFLKARSKLGQLGKSCVGRGRLHTSLRAEFSRNITVPRLLRWAQSLV